MRDATSRDEHMRELWLSLLQCSSKPYLSMLTSWMQRGDLRGLDPYGEFAVQEREELSRASLREDFFDTWWDERCSIRDRMLPPFLAPFAERILATGKCLTVIRDCAIADRHLAASSAAAVPSASSVYSAGRRGSSRMDSKEQQQQQQQQNPEIPFVCKCSFSSDDPLFVSFSLSIVFSFFSSVLSVHPLSHPLPPFPTPT